MGAVCSVGQVRRITLSLSASINVYPHDSEEFAYLTWSWTELSLFLICSWEEMNLTALLRGLADLILDFDHFQLVLGQSWTWTILENQSVRWVNIYLQIYPDPWSFSDLKNLDEYHTWPLFNVTMLASDWIINFLPRSASINIYLQFCGNLLLYHISS